MLIRQDRDVTMIDDEITSTFFKYMYDGIHNRYYSFSPVDTSTTRLILLK